MRGTVSGCSTVWSEDLRVHAANGTRAGAGKRSEPFPDRAAKCSDPRVEQAVEVVEIHEDGT
jgi:hypothetical protein